MEKQDTPTETSNSETKSIDKPTPQSKTTPKSSRKNLIILIVAVVVMLAAATFCFLYFTKSWIFAEDSESSTNTDQTDLEPIFSKENYPKFDASTATQPLVMAFYKDFTGDTTAKTTDFGFTKTHQAYERLVKKQVDLIVVTQPSKDEFQLIADIGDEYVVTPVVAEGFVFFVNKDNPVNSITVEQVQNIYTGAIKNWKDLGGQDLKIAPFQRPENSGSQTGMINLVMDGKALMQPEREDLVIDDMFGLVASVVTTFDNTQSAIGYSYYYYVTTMYQDMDADIANSVKLLHIDNVKPEPKTIQNGTYPFTTAYYIVTRKSDAGNESIQKLKDAMLSPRGQKVAEKAKYVPAK